MLKNVHLKDKEYFYVQDYMKQYPTTNIFVLCGARGCGKTYSVCEEIKKMFSLGKVGLYIRNSRAACSSARSYFSFLSDENSQIKLGRLGAGSVTLSTKDTDILIGYTLYLGDQETFKSSRKKIDYIIYEEFSTFGNERLNRAFNLIELLESIRQSSPDYKMFAIANNLFEDDLFSVNFTDDSFLQIQIHKKAQLDNVKNKAVQNYLSGDILVPQISYNLTNYQCVGYVEVASTKIFLYDGGENLLNRWVLSTRGIQTALRLDSSTARIIVSAVYKNVHDRNRLEFVVGLVEFSYKRLFT